MLAGFSNHDPGLVGFRELHPEHHWNHMIRVIYKTFNYQFKPILVQFLIDHFKLPRSYRETTVSTHGPVLVTG